MKRKIILFWALLIFVISALIVSMTSVTYVLASSSGGQQFGTDDIRIQLNVNVNVTAEIISSKMLASPLEPLASVSKNSEVITMEGISLMLNPSMHQSELIDQLSRKETGISKTKATSNDSAIMNPSPDFYDHSSFTPEDLCVTNSSSASDPGVTTTNSSDYYEGSDGWGDLDDVEGDFSDFNTILKGNTSIKDFMGSTVYRGTNRFHLAFHGWENLDDWFKYVITNAIAINNSVDNDNVIAVTYEVNWANMSVLLGYDFIDRIRDAYFENWEGSSSGGNYRMVYSVMGVQVASAPIGWRDYKQLTSFDDPGLATASDLDNVFGDVISWFGVTISDILPTVEGVWDTTTQGFFDPIIEPIQDFLGIGAEAITDVLDFSTWADYTRGIINGGLQLPQQILTSVGGSVQDFGNGLLLPLGNTLTTGLSAFVDSAVGALFGVVGQVGSVVLPILFIGAVIFVIIIAILAVYLYLDNKNISIL